MASTKQAIAKESEKKKELLVETPTSRGRIFHGFVKKKFDKRAVIEFERTVYVPKYERFTKKHTKLHARIPENLKVSVGNYVKIRECRPLSKITHFVIIDILKSSEERK